MPKPGKWLYIVAGVVAFGGSGASVFHGVSSSTDSIRSMKRAAMPGEATLELSAGRHGIFLERESSVASDIDAAMYAPDIHTVHCTVLGPTGKPVQVQQTGRVEAYNLGGYSGELLGDLHILKPGPHQLTCKDDASGSGPFRIAIGEGFTVGDLMVAIVCGASSIMIGLAIFFFAFIRRRSRRNEDPDPDAPQPAGTPQT